MPSHLTVARAALSMPSQRGSSKLELLASIILIATVAAILLDRLTYYQEAAEKANVEYTISTLKAALRVQMGTMMIEGRVRDYPLLEQQDPLDWLDNKPAVCRESEGSHRPPRGCWSFDRRSRTLTYWPLRDDYLQPDRAGMKLVRLQVSTLYGEPDPQVAGNRPVISVAIRVIEPHQQQAQR